MVIGPAAFRVAASHNRAKRPQLCLPLPTCTETLGLYTGTETLGMAEKSLGFLYKEICHCEDGFEPVM